LDYKQFITLALTDSAGDELAVAGFFSCPNPVGAMKETMAMVVTTNKQAMVRSFFIIVTLNVM
jgi:hypothetical protein